MITVLLVDDHPVVIVGIRRILAAAPDIDVVGEAHDGANAIHLTRVLRPDVITLDLRMPGPSGIQTVRRLRDEGHWSAVIIVTAYGDQAYVQQAREAGANGLVLKSAPPDQLITAIRDAAADRVPASPGGTDGASNGWNGARSTLSRRSGALQPVDRHILSCVSEGATSREIGVTLGLTEATVKRRLSRIFRELGSVDRAHAVAQALRRGMI